MSQPLDEELQAAYRRTAVLATNSMLHVDRTGWTDEQWIADARHLMDHPDGSSACMLNGHVWAMLRAIPEPAAGSNEAVSVHG